MKSSQNRYKVSEVKLGETYLAHVRSSHWLGELNQSGPATAVQKRDNYEREVGLGALGGKTGRVELESGFFIG